MTASIWVLVLVVFVAVVFLRMGRHRYTRRQRVLPLVVVLVLALNYVVGMPTTGNDVAFELSCLAIGALFGVAMVAVTAVEHEEATGQVWVRAGAAYLILWVILLGSRVFFAYSITGWARQDIGRWFITNHLSFNSITPAFVLMTIGSIGVFGIGTAMRANSVAGSQPALRRRPVQ
jgi:membrane protein CcdC involved in cytochrome C biogenesis